jgi:hypothetical protein
MLADPEEGESMNHYLFWRGLLLGIAIGPMIILILVFLAGVVDRTRMEISGRIARRRGASDER